MVFGFPFDIIIHTRNFISVPIPLPCLFSFFPSSLY